MSVKPFYFAKAMMARYPAAEYALFFELGNKVGYADNRADAVAMSLWPSRGLCLNGFELKMERGDWLREKKTPAKAETIAKYCDFWWLVTPSAKAYGKEIVKPGELPDTWGWLEGTGDSLRVVKKATRLKPRTLTMSIMAAMFRDIQSKYVHRSQVSAMVENARQEQKQREAKDGDYWQKQYQDLAHKLLGLSAKFGFDPLNCYNPEEVKKGYELVRSGLPDDFITQLTHLGAQVRRIGQQVEESLEISKVMMKTGGVTGPTGPTGLMGTNDAKLQHQTVDNTPENVQADVSAATVVEPEDLPDDTEDAL